MNVFGLLKFFPPRVWVWAGLFAGVVWAGSNVPVVGSDGPSAGADTARPEATASPDDPERFAGPFAEPFNAVADGSIRTAPPALLAQPTVVSAQPGPRAAPAAPTSRPFLGNFLGRLRQNDRPGVFASDEEHRAFDEFVARYMPNTAEALRELAAAPSTLPASPRNRPASPTRDNARDNARDTARDRGRDTARDNPREAARNVGSPGDAPPPGEAAAQGSSGEFPRPPGRLERRRWLTQTALFQFRRFERGRKDFPELEDTYLRDVRLTDEMVGLLREFRSASGDRRDEIRSEVRVRLTSVAESLIEERRRRIDRLKAQLEKEEAAVARDENNLDSNVDKRVDEIFARLGAALAPTTRP